MRPRSKLLALLFLALLFTASGAALTSYDIEIRGETARTNLTFELTPEGQQLPLRWRTSWTLPEGSELLSIRDNDGPVEEYTVEGTSVSFETRIDRNEGKEVIEMRFRTPGIVEEEFNGLNLVKMQLSGLPDEDTQVQVDTGEALRSESHTFGFSHDLGRSSVTYDGKGPVTFYLTTVDGGEEYRHFVLFGGGNLSEEDGMFGIVPAVLGFAPEMNRLPVIVLPDEEYDERIDEWSTGQYRTGGLIFLRESAMEEKDVAATLMHEVAHAFNEHALRWSRASSAWFDEGTSKYVEFLVKERRNIRQPEIFGEPITWRAPCEDSPGTCRYTLRPRGTPEDLWDYYRSGSDFMYSWTPRDPSNRRFGYAFSELLIREYVMERNFSALHPVYSSLLEIDRKYTDPRRSTQRILGMMGADFSPCEGDTLEQTRACLERVNDMEPEIPESASYRNITEDIEIRPIERPNVTTYSNIDIQREIERSEDFLNKILRGLGEFLRGLIESVGG